MDGAVVSVSVCHLKYLPKSCWFNSSCCTAFQVLGMTASEDIMANGHGDYELGKKLLVSLTYHLHCYLVLHSTLNSGPIQVY